MRAISPTKKTIRQGTRGQQDEDTSAKSADPAEFESDFADEDADPKLSGALRSQTNHTDNAKTTQEITYHPSGQDTDQMSISNGESSALSALPTEVRDKLRKFEKYESRYHGILRNSTVYRVADTS